MTETGPGGKDDAAWDTHKGAFEAKEFSKYYDPCQEAANRSIKCLHRNGGDRELCQDYFLAYRECKKAWTKARSEEKWKVSSPGLFGSKKE